MSRLPRERPERRPFSAPMQAQVWYEWRLRGIGFPIMVLFTLLVLIAGGMLLDPNNTQWSEFGSALLFTSILIPGFCGSYMGATGDSVRAMSTFPAFGATRPMSNADLVGAKVWTAGLAAVTGW